MHDRPIHVYHVYHIYQDVLLSMHAITCIHIQGETNKINLNGCTFVDIATLSYSILVSKDGASL